MNTEEAGRCSGPAGRQQSCSVLEAHIFIVTRFQHKYNTEAQEHYYNLYNPLNGTDNTDMQPYRLCSFQEGCSGEQS